MNNIENLELKIAKFLRWGVLVAGILMLAGWLMQIRIHGNPFFNFQTYDPLSFHDILFLHLKHKHWGALVSYAGLAVLISLPLIRVVLTAGLFMRQKEYLLALIALIVLAGLIISMSLGIEL